jgi:23S rRNA pseudouridine1911/1915/1917 synthase
MLNILYEDNHILVAIKPRGILSQADGSDKPDMLTLLKEYIKDTYHKLGNVYLGLVHRLDINTEGVMVFAKYSKAASRLSKAIQEHKFEKRYKAIVEGTFPTNEKQTLINYIYKDEKQKKSLIQKDGQKAILDFIPLTSYSINGVMVTEVDILLKTGRFHQIRCQMSAIGHPLYGDKKYGSKNTIPNEEFPLTAYRLSFPHPTKEEIMTFTMEDKK